MNPSEIAVRHNEAAHRFEAGAETNPAHLDYSLGNGSVDLFHTEVPPAMQGRGVAAGLTKAAFAWAGKAHRRVIPTCPFVKAFLAKHPEYDSLL